MKPSRSAMSSHRLISRCARPHSVGVADLGERRAQEDASLGDHDHVVGHLLHLVEEVRREELRAALVGDGAQHRGEDVAPHDRIEAGRRLVEHQQLGTVRQRGDEPRARLLSLGEVADARGGVEFSNGVIEAEIAGAPVPGVFEGARGFVGIAFRVQNDSTYDAFYLRPTNGRAEDQERRNHAAQYISHPQWPWFRLRRETPSKYESYVDLVPDAWTRIRIEVRGEKARLYVHDQPQPVLIVNDLKSGANGKGGVALWIGPGTVAHFRNLTVTSDSTSP